MAALELKFLGDLQVIRDGRCQVLPPSRKTRALLAYLALNHRAFRREHLCELLWEIPDDPRGSLRWSLSKLRHLVDDPARPRIVADRITVQFDASDVVIDVTALRELADGELDRCPVEQLEAAVARFGGNPLEGLELPDFHDFDAWCSAERESATRCQTRLLSALVRRLGAEPERALPHARALVRIAPYDEAARASLIRLLVALGRADLAEQQYKVGNQLLKEAGCTSSGELFRALRGEPGAGTGARMATAEASTLLRPSVAAAPTAPAQARPSGATVAPSAAVASSTAGAPAATSTPGTWVAPAPQAAPASATALIGRDLELSQIASTMAQSAGQRCGRMLLITGEPGIGKSCLLESAGSIARQSGALLLQACAYESEAIRPFALWLDALRRLGPAHDAALVASTDQANRDRLFSGLGELIATQARQRPVVLMFDDLQWSDESSAAALHYVARTHRDLPFFGILAARSDELRDNMPVLRAVRELRNAGQLEEIRLRPLPENAVRELISARAPQADSSRLCSQCGGNPLLAIELARAESSGDSGQSLGELVQERLARFDAEGGEVLRWAAVLAPRIDARTLARVSGFDWNRIGEVLETAGRQSMLVPVEGGFRFYHDLIARGIYNAISPARRRTMHRRIAELLEQDTAFDSERAADLAHHASQSGDPGLAARAMVSAGRLCLRFFANEEALALVRKGLHWVQQLPPVEKVCLTLELQEINLKAGPLERWQEAAQEYARLAGQALDLGALAHARRGYYMASYVHWMHGQWSGAREEILQSERVARGGDDEEHILGMAEAARCLAMLERDLTHADAMLMEAQALAARKHVSHPAIPAALAMLRFHEGRFEEAAELFREARTLARSYGDRISEFQAGEYLTMIEIERGRLDAACAHCAVLVELAEKLREGSERPFARALDGLCRYASSDDAGPLDSALVALRAADAKHRLAYTLTRAAFIDLGRERPDVASARASEALACAEALDRATEVALAHVALAYACRAQRDEKGFREHVAALAGLEGKPIAQWARSRMDALLQPPASSDPPSGEQRP